MQRPIPWFPGPTTRADPVARAREANSPRSSGFVSGSRSRIDPRERRAMPAAVAQRAFTHPAPVSGAGTAGGSPADAVSLRRVFQADAFEEACASRIGLNADEVKLASDILMEAAPLMVGKHVVVADDAMVRSRSRNNSFTSPCFFSLSASLPKAPSGRPGADALGRRRPLAPTDIVRPSIIHRTPPSGRRARRSSPRESSARRRPHPSTPDRAGKGKRRALPPPTPPTDPTPSPRPSPTSSARSTSTAWTSSGACASS